jgi:hypothetical protein
MDQMPVKGDSTSYVFEWDLKDIDISQTQVSLPNFLINGESFYVIFRIKDGNSSYGCYLHHIDSSFSFPGPLFFQFDLVNRQDNQVVQTGKWDWIFYKNQHGYGLPSWIAPLTMRDHVFKVKVSIDKTFSDFVHIPGGFDTMRLLLFDKLCSNFSFKVGNEVVYVLHRVLTERSDYFRAMLMGSFIEAAVPINPQAEVPIYGIAANVFKMIIEWIYTMNIQSLNGFSSTLLADLESAYVAADMYLLTDLCKSIVKYLEFIVNQQTFGEIYQIARRIGSKSLESIVFQSWLSNSDDFNKNDPQICILIDDEH